MFAQPRHDRRRFFGMAALSLAVLNTAGGRIAYRFHARDLHLTFSRSA